MSALETILADLDVVRGAINEMQERLTLVQNAIVEAESNDLHAIAAVWRRMSEEFRANIEAAQQQEARLEEFRGMAERGELPDPQQIMEMIFGGGFPGGGGRPGPGDEGFEI